MTVEQCAIVSPTVSNPRKVEGASRVPGDGPPQGPDTNVAIQDMLGRRCCHGPHYQPYLYQHGETAFQELKTELDVTEGNLSSHLQTMEGAGAVRVEKQFVDRRPQTTYELTGDGREQFEAHIDLLDGLIRELTDLGPSGDT